MKGGNTLANSRKPGKQLLNPEILTELPPAPEQLDEIAEHVWEDVGQLLVDEKILTNLDLTVLKHYCLLSSLCSRFEVYFSSTECNIFGTTKTGLMRQNPYLRQYQELVKQLLMVSEHFGMTPKARGKVGIKNNNADKKGDKLTGFLEGTNTNGQQEINLD